MWSRARIFVTVAFVIYGAAVLLLSNGVLVHVALYALGLVVAYVGALLGVAYDRRRHDRPPRRP